MVEKEDISATLVFNSVLTLAIARVDVSIFISRESLQPYASRYTYLLSSWPYEIHWEFQLQRKRLQSVCNLVEDRNTKQHKGSRRQKKVLFCQF
jgi:hypothetical protein